MEDFMEKGYWWAPIVYFGLHPFVSSTIFIIVALPAVGLFVLVEFFGRIVHMPVFAMSVFKFLEYAILLMDSYILIAFLGKDAWKFVKRVTQ